MTAGPAGLDLWWVRVPLRSAHVSAHGATSEREVIVARLTTGSGIEGWGECDALEHPGYGVESTATAWESLTTWLGPALLRDGLVPAAPAAPMAVAALATALLDAGLRTTGRSLAAHLGAGRARVASTAVCGLAPSIDALLETVAERAGWGHRSVKLKVRPGWDCEPVEAVRSAFPRLGLAVDANGSYADASDLPRSFADAGLDYVEQPLPVGDLAGAAAVADRLGVRVALDEGLGSVEDLRAAHRAGAMQVANVKPARLGGPAEAAAFAAECGSLGVDAFCGGMVELGVGRAAALAVAALDTCTLPTDLGPTARYVDVDLTDPVALDADGTLPVPTGPGIGVLPKLERVEAAAVARWSSKG